MYDPLVSAVTPHGVNYPDSYWASQQALPSDPELDTDIAAEVAVIGSGFTGLSAAWKLAKQYNVSVVLVEANQAGWGCSGRNAGFALPGSGRLSMAQMQSKWGNDIAARVQRQYHQALDTVQAMISAGNIDCDLIRGGYLKIAHTRTWADTMASQVQQLRQASGQQIEFLAADDIRTDFVNANAAYGGLYYPDCFALNPLKLCLGYRQMAVDAGVQLYANSPVVGWQTSQGKHRLNTPNGSVTANKVILATNGYTPKRMHKLVDKRHFPVLSSVMVTPVLSAGQRQQIAMQDGLMVMDTRALKYYYRLLPDGRLLFGGRGAIYGKDADKQSYRLRLEKALHHSFPGLSDVAAEYFWSGWVSVALDSYPRIYQSEDSRLFYAMGYCGSGLTFSCQAGHHLADKVMGQETAEIRDLPLLQSGLPRYPFTGLRRLGLLAYYLWYGLVE